MRSHAVPALAAAWLRPSGTQREGAGEGLICLSGVCPSPRLTAGLAGSRAWTGAEMGPDAEMTTGPTAQRPPGQMAC